MTSKCNRNEFGSIAWVAVAFSLFFHMLFLAALYGLWLREPVRVSLGAGYVTVDLADFDAGTPGGDSPSDGKENKKALAPIKTFSMGQKHLAPMDLREGLSPSDKTGQGEGIGAGNDTGDGRGGAGGGVGEGLGGGDGILSQYVRQVLARIERNKQYPRLSQENGEEGVVLVDLRIGRSGQLLSYDLRKVPPSARLIEATKSTIQAAAPFPPLPEYYAQESLSLQVPVRYQLH